MQMALCSPAVFRAEQCEHCFAADELLRLTVNCTCAKIYLQNYCGDVLEKLKQSEGEEERKLEKTVRDIFQWALSTSLEEKAYLAKLDELEEIVEETLGVDDDG